MFQILYFFKIVQSACPYTSFDQFQLNSTNFYQEQSYLRGSQYAFGVWTQYAPIRKNQYSNKSKSYFDSTKTLNGFHILNFQNDGNIQTLFYQQPVYQTGYPNLIILQNTQSGVLSYKIQEGLYYHEGYWIFTYFSFNYDNKYNFASYSTGDDRFFNFLITNRRLQTQTINAKLEHGGQGLYKIGTSYYNLQIFLGRISIITLFQNSIIFFNNNDKAKFITFISTCSIPQACQNEVELLFFKEPCNKFNCTHRQYHTDIPGLRYMFDFWLKRDSQKVRSENELIFQYGGLFPNLDPFYQLALYWRVINQDVILLHHLDIYYLVPGELQTQYNDNFLIQLFKPRSSYVQWNYLKYEFQKIGVYQYVYVSIYQSCCDIWEQYYVLNFAYYQQYSNYQATLTFFTESINATIVPFEGMISNLRFRYCYTLDFQFGKEFNINCNALCKTCTGPTQYDCSSCYEDQNRQLQSEIKQCLCKIDYQESDNLKCEKTFLSSIYEMKELYKEFQISQIQQQFKCKYGYFEVWKDLQFMGCIVCPYYNQVDDQINCINCIMDSHKWYLNPICNIDYKSDGYHSYFNEQLDYYSQELFIIHIDLMVTELCYGCEQIINAKNKRSINRYINGQNILYQCKSFMYVNNNSCKYCYNNCVNCQDNGLCVQCDNKFYIRNEMCQSCPEECSQCLLDVQLDQIKCISCQNGHALVNNKCLKCGYLCDDCEQRVNKNSGQEYLKCLKCSYNSYISLDGESCYYNTLEHCIYPFQFSIIDNSISTILYDFQPQESQFIKTGCTYCSPISYLTPINNIFTCTPQGIDQIISGCYQTLHYSDQMDCSIGINNQMDIGFGYCSQFIPHCITCLRLNWEYVNICYLCEDGYYNDYYTSFCKPCNPECKTCIQTDSSKIVKPSIIKVFSMIANFKGSLQYQLWTQNPNNQSISIICMECVDGYVKYFDKCIQQCPTNCKECKIINEQYICVACIQFESSNYQVYNGRCIQCPQNCQSCYPRTNEEKLQINPYFSNINFDYFSHKCISSFSNNLIYDQDIQQFIKCDSFGQGCQNQIQIEIYLYCNQIDLDNYLNSLDQQQQIIQRKFHLLLQNFDLSLYEYYEYYLYLNQNYIKKLTYQIKLVDNQICSLNQDLYIESTLQTNCFNLIELNLNIYGAYNPFILNNVLRISNFTHIKLQNINFHIQKGRINLSNIKDYSVIFETVNFYQNSDLKVIDQLVQIQESSEFIIQNMSIYNLNFNSQNGLFLFINQFASQKLMFNNLTIINSRFYNTYTFNFNQTQSITLEILHLNIQDSEFQNSTLIQKSILNQNFKIENLIIQNSVIVNTICFLNLQELNLVELRGIYISNSIFQDSNFLQSSNILNLKEFNFQNLNLKGQSTLITNQIHSNFEIITLQNGYFKNNIYQNKQAFILLLNSQTIYLQSIEFINNSIDYVNLKNTFIKNIELSIMNIESEIVVFDNLIVQRGIGFPEFTIKNTNIFTLLNSSVTLFEKYSFKSLFNNDDCQITTFNKFLYNNLINLQDVSEINIKNTNITNLILYDSVLIEIQKLSQENSQFTIYNCNLSSNILHQINNYQKISLISISSNFYLDLNLTQVTFSQNLQNLQKESNPKKQSLILILEASQSQTLIKNCLIDRNMNLNGFGSILYIDADKIIVENTSFLSNSVFIYDTVRQFLRWGFSEKMYLESLQKLYVTSSNGGNGNFQGREIIFKNLQLKNSSSKQGAAFVINMKENGIIEIQNSTFNNLESDLIESSQGGAFHISSQQSYLSIKVQSSIFFNISTRKSGSIFYIVPSKVLFNISILHSNIQDVYSIQGGFIYVEKSIHQIQVISMKNCSVSQNQQNFINYINSLSDLSNNELNILTQDYSFIYCYDCQFRIKDFSISKYPFIPLFQFYGSIYLKNIFITNIVFSSKLLLFSTVQQSDQIIMNGLELRNCTQQNILENKIPSLEQEKKLNMNQIVISCSNNLIDSPQSLLSYHESYSNQNEITLLHMLINQIQQFQSSVTQFLGFEYQNKITLFQIKVLNNTCNYCLNGIMNFMNSQKSLIAIQDIIVQNSSCGSNGCISFISSFNQRLLQFQEFQTSTDKQNTLINISQLYCTQNQAFYGGCLFIQSQTIQIISSLIQGNTANYGGGIFITGNDTTLITKELLIINNRAKFGSGIYSQDNLKKNLYGLELIDNLGLNQVDEQPQQIYLEIFKNKLIIPKVTEKTEDLQISEIIAENGQKTIINMPTGISLSKYRKFEIINNRYNKQAMEVKLYAINSQLEIVRNLSNTYCELQISNINSQLGNKQNLRLNKNKVYFNQTTYSYNLDDIIFFIPQDSNQLFEFQIKCNSIFVPIVNKINKFIEGYHQNYFLKLLIKPYECQLGEYSQDSEDYCHQCDIDQKQYSVTVGATYCQTVDDQKIQEITQAQIYLKQSYWRISVTTMSIEFCLNRQQNCIGGWGVGNDLCQIGYLGALCEQCDYYDIRGGGSYQRNQQFECQICEMKDFEKLINFLITVAIFGLLFLFINNLSQRRVQAILINLSQFKTSFNQYYQKQIEVLIGQSIKIILLYFQIISSTQELNSCFSDGIQQLINYFGNPFILLGVFKDCQLLDTSISVIYLQILQNFICLLIIITLFVCVCFGMIFFLKFKITQMAFFNFAYLLYIYIVGSFIRSMIQLIGFRDIQETYWIYKNVSYNYNNIYHLRLVFICFLPIIVGLGIILPTLLLQKLKSALFLTKRIPFKDFGFWFTSYSTKCNQWESYKLFLCHGIIFFIIMIDANTSLRGAIAYSLLISYTKLFQTNKVYYHKLMNTFENQLNIISVLILISSSTLFIDENQTYIFYDLIKILMNTLFSLSLVIIIHHFWKINLQSIKTIMCFIFERLGQRFDIFNQYNLYKLHSITARKRRQKLFQQLRIYLKQQSKAQLIIKREFQDSELYKETQRQ